MGFPVLRRVSTGLQLVTNEEEEAKDAILSDVLSAGEKQMLSFLCYNASATRTCLFIDEPEISLHVDWQRVLFPELLQQSTGNQFIVATHSPFIYSKYADKELVLAEYSREAIIDLCLKLYPKNPHVQRLVSEARSRLA